MVKRKRGNARGRRVRRRVFRRARRAYKRISLRTLAQAHETKKRYFNSSNYYTQGAAGVTLDKALYQPFNWMGSGSTDSQIVGNSIFLKSFMLKGKIVTAPSAVYYAGPCVLHVYLIKARDEVNTGALAEAWTTSTATVNAWFSGSTNPATWYPNSSKCSVLYHKKINYQPDLSTSYDNAGVLNAQRAGKEMNFFCRKTFNKMIYFKESASGAMEAGLFGRNSNLYWMMCVETPVGYSDIQFLISSTHMVTFKDV